MRRLRTLGPRISTIDTRAAKLPDKTTDPHYLSAEHRAWREKVVANANGACQWPGCGKREGRMFADHIVERSDGGADLAVANGQCLCAAHHNVKTSQQRAARLKS